VCAAVHLELARAMQAAGLPVAASQTGSHIQVAATVVLVSETPQFGSPVMMRTYSISLAGTSSLGPLRMPAPRIFEFDSVYGRGLLQQNARLIATSAVEAVETFSANRTF
jgi:hypothetical protein